MSLIDLCELNAKKKHGLNLEPYLLEEFLLFFMFLAHMFLGHMFFRPIYFRAHVILGPVFKAAMIKSQGRLLLRPKEPGGKSLRDRPCGGL
jgi:hypothetical protein